MWLEKQNIETHLKTAFLVANHERWSILLVIIETDFSVLGNRLLSGIMPELQLDQAVVPKEFLKSGLILCGVPFYTSITEQNQRQQKGISLTTLYMHIV